jgi:hypothetical protein
VINSETLPKLLADGLALMEPNDPALAKLTAETSITADSVGPKFMVYFFIYGENKRETFGSGATPEAALEDFKAKYQPPLTTAGQIAALKAQIAKLEGAKS